MQSIDRDYLLVLTVNGAFCGVVLPAAYLLGCLSVAWT